MSRTSGSPLWATKLPRYKATFQPSQLEQPLRAQTMGQSPSQEAQTRANAEPKQLHKSAHRMRHKPSTLLESMENTRVAARRKEANGKIDETSEGDEDDESDWSDWNAKVKTTAKWTPTPDHDLGQSTYETTSGSEEAESEGDAHISRAGIDARGTNQASQELGHVGSPWYSPPVSGDPDVQDWKENGVPHSPALRSASKTVHLAASNDKTDSKNSSDDESLEEDLQNDPGLAKTAQKTQRTSAEQHLRAEGKSVPAASDFRHVDQKDEGIAPTRTVTSDQDTSSPVSVFDAVQDSALVDSAVLQYTDLKLKRGRAGEKIPGLQGQPARKRRKHSIFSPPTSVPTEDEDSPEDPSPGLKAIQGRFRINRPVAKPKPTLDQVGKDQGSVGSWVKPLSHSSSLKHPIFNPSPLKRFLRSRATDQVGQSMKPNAAASSGAPHRSTTISRQSQANSASIAEESSNDEALKISKPSKTVFTSPKGKSKAKPGVEYSSPPKVRGRATRLGSSKKSGRNRRPAPKSPATNDDVSEYEAEQSNMEDPESGSEANDLDAESGESKDDSSTSKELTCSTCDRKFRDQKQLRIHKKNNGGQARLYECWKCGDEFDDKTILLRHQLRAKHRKESFHEQRTGAFSKFEKIKLGKFMVDYCDEHGIDETVFRQMMTDSCRRGRDETWSWPGVTRYEFLNDYYDVLPDRARKSMQRYRERNFQNLEHKKQWTEEDDKLLLDLVDELGQKWIEIGLRLNRTQDSVTQRYKKTLKDRDAAQTGLWSLREKDALAKVIGDMKDELGLEKTSATDANIVWSEVSERMGGIRTAQQCSTHWHRVLKPGPKYKRPSRTGGRKFKSKELVLSDDENEPMVMEDEPPRAQFVGVVVPRKATGQAGHAKPRNSPGSDGRDSETQQDNEDARRGPHVADRRQISPELGSSDPYKRDLEPSLSGAHSDDIADHDDRAGDVNESVERTAEEWERLEAHSDGIADRGDRFNDVDILVERTAEEWERLLGAEDSLPPLRATSSDHVVSGNQGNEGSHGIAFEQAHHSTWSERAEGPATDPKASRNPLNQKTPDRVMALSQVFEQTQAPTSVLRQQTPTVVKIPGPNSSRPSPNIGLRLRPNLPQYSGSLQQQNFRRGPVIHTDGNETNNDYEMEEIGYSSGESDKDTDMEDVEQTRDDSRLSDGEHAAFSEDPGPVESDREEQNVPALSALGASVEHHENDMPVNRGAETSEDDDTSGEDNGSEDESGTGEEESKSEYESGMTEDSDDGDENEDSNDSMVKGTRDDFMANIKESAKLSKLRSPDISRRFVEESDDESG